MQLARLQFEDGNGHVADVVLPHEDEVAAAQVVAVAQEVGRPVLRLGEELLAVALEDVVREGGSAFEDAIAQPRGALCEQLTDVDLVLRLKRGSSHPSLRLASQWPSVSLPEELHKEAALPVFLVVLDGPKDGGPHDVVPG